MTVHYGPYGSSRHCCIKAKGVLAMAQSSKAGSTGPVENHNKPGIRGLLRGY